jgi:ubiquinone/menaquinone biosynthesis C-methylase UbiE
MENSIKNSIKKRYSQIAMSGNSDCCCMPGECTPEDSPIDATMIIGYNKKELEAIPREAILGVGCGAPLHHANLQKGEVVVDLGSGAGIDAFLSANHVTEMGSVIGIDMTDEMLDKAQKNAKDGNYSNVEFRKGDIEEKIPVNDGAVDAVISNCVINLTTDKTKVFHEVHRILKEKGRMVISDLVTDREVTPEEISDEQWCSCIDGALTKENYLDCIRSAGFSEISILEERSYMDGEKLNGRKISSLVVKATK